jgi:hypothetical protein
MWVRALAGTVTGDFSPAALGRILNNDKAITAFSLAGSTGTIDEGAGIINVIVPYETDLTSLAPTVTHTGVSYDPAGPQNFTSPASYTVTALDGSIRTYTVTAVVADLSSIGVGGTYRTQYLKGEFLDTTDLTITGTDSAGNTMSIPLSACTFAGFSSSTAGPCVVTITVNGTGVSGSFTVTILNDEKVITAFSLAGSTGTIDEGAGTISVTVAYGTDLTSQTPTVAYTGASYNPVGPQNFTSPVPYTVTALDGSTRTYTVTATVRGQISITISGAGDENISGMPVGGITISRAANGSINATIGGGYSSVAWYVDAIARGSSASITVRARDYAAGNHTLTVLVYKDGIPYTNRVAFVVTE